MTVFDLIAVALITSSVVAGALRGLMRALVATALLVGVFAAARCYEAASLLLIRVGVFEAGTAARAGGFVLLIGLLLLLGLLSAHLLRDSLRRAKLENIERLLGAAFGFARGFLVCSVAFLALTAFPVGTEAVANARTAPALAEGARLLAFFASGDLCARFLTQYGGLFE